MADRTRGAENKQTKRVRCQRSPIRYIRIAPLFPISEGLLYGTLRPAFLPVILRWKVPSCSSLSALPQAQPKRSSGTKRNLREQNTFNRWKCLRCRTYFITVSASLCIVFSTSCPIRDYLHALSYLLHLSFPQRCCRYDFRAIYE
jgi:hypothetical protein